MADVRFNGKEYTKNWFSHRELMQGAIIDIDIAAQPNKQRGVRTEDPPYSFSVRK